MYSPKIKADLIPILFRMAEEKHKPMTNIVDEILRPVLTGYEEQKAVPYCVSCYSQVEANGRQVTAYCKLCQSETFVLYRMPTESDENCSLRKEVS